MARKRDVAPRAEALNADASGSAEVPGSNPDLSAADGSIARRPMTMSARTRQLIGWALLAVIVLVALFLRLYRLPELTGFGPDQGWEAAAIDGMIQSGRPLLHGIGISSGAYSRGPAFEYLLTPGFFISGGDPAGGAVTVALLDTVTIILLAVLGHAVGGWPAGLTSAALWAAAPLVVSYARIMWPPQVVPVFALVALLSLVQVGRGRSRWFLLVGPTIVVAWQVHDQGVLLLPVVLAWLILIRPRVERRILAWSLALGALMLTPLVLYDLTHEFATLRGVMSQVLGGASSTSQVRPGPMTQLAGVARGAMELLPLDRPESIFLWLTAAGGFAACLALLRGPKRPSALILVLLATSTLLYAFWPGLFNTYYLFLVLPVPFLLAGVAVSAALERWRVGGMALSGLILAISVQWASSTAMEIRDTPPYWGQLASMKALVRAVADDAGRSEFAVRLVSRYRDLGYYEYPYAYLFNKLVGESTDRVDLPTYVIIDDPEFEASSGLVGRSAGGATFVRFDPPALGDDLLGGVFEAASDSDSVTANEPGVEILRDGASPFARITSQLVSNGTSVESGARYVLQFLSRTSHAQGYGRVYAQVRDAGGDVLTTFPDGGGLLLADSADWRPGSLEVDVPDGGTSVTLVLRNSGVGSVDFRDVRLRPLISPALPGRPIWSSDSAPAASLPPSSSVAGISPAVPQFIVGRETKVASPGSCYMDSLNGQVWTSDVPVVGDLPTVVISGWALDGDTRELARATYLRLQDAQGTTYYGTTSQMERPDLGAYFGDPGLRWAGYRAEFSPSAIPSGEYEAMVVMDSERGPVLCAAGRRLRV